MPQTDVVHPNEKFQSCAVVGNAGSLKLYKVKASSAFVFSRRDSCSLLFLFRCEEQVNESFAKLI
jgi:hypothetical protein